MRRYLLVIAIVLLAMLIFGCTSASTSGSGYQTGTGAQQGGGAKQSETPSQPTVYKFGERVVVGDFAYTFNNLTSADQIGTTIFGTFSGVKADGIFIILDVTIENVGKESETLYSSTIKIIDDQNRKYEHDISPETYWDMYYADKAGAKSFTFEQMQPGLPKRGVVIFDIPKDLKGYFEISSNSLFSSEKKIVTFTK
jgi:hypothetical protein